MNRTFREQFQIDETRDPLAEIDFRGASDSWIVRAVAEANGFDWSEAQQQAFIERYATVLTGVMRERDGALLPGVQAALDALAARGIAQGLGTGNFRRSAFVKLDHYGIGHYFREGGFGDDSPDRPTLLAAGLERMRAHAGPDAACVVIGDTVHDITAGRAIGARVVAVRTGFADPGDLEAHSPDALLDDLSDLPASLAAILG